MRSDNCNHHVTLVVGLRRVAGRWGVLIVAVAGLLGGCGRGAGLDRIPVTGTVNLDGQPMTQGSIIFEAIEPTIGPRAAAVVKSGAFAFTRETGPVEGTYRVMIFAEQNIAVEEPEVGASLPNHQLPPNPVGKEFNENSKLQATLSDASAPLHFDVTSASQTPPTAAETDPAEPVLP